MRTRRASNATAQRSHGGRRLLSVRTCSDCHQSKATRSSFDTGCPPDFLQCILNVPSEQMASLSLLTPVMSFSAAAACGRYVAGAQACMCCCRLLSLVWLPPSAVKHFHPPPRLHGNGMSQPRAPPPWPPRPIYLAHFLHPPGGSLHPSVPESTTFVINELITLPTLPLAIPIRNLLTRSLLFPLLQRRNA